MFFILFFIIFPSFTFFYFFIFYLFILFLYHFFSLFFSSCAKIFSFILNHVLSFGKGIERIIMNKYMQVFKKKFISWISVERQEL